MRVMLSPVLDHQHMVQCFCFLISSSIHLCLFYRFVSVSFSFFIEVFTRCWSDGARPSLQLFFCLGVLPVCVIALFLVVSSM